MRISKSALLDFLTSDPRFQFRSLEAIKRHFDASADAVMSAIAESQDSFNLKNSRRPNVGVLISAG